MANLSRLPTPIIEQWEWQYDGVCRTVDPESSSRPTPSADRSASDASPQAKQYCEHCPVSAGAASTPCMVQEPYGVWGGLTPRERDRILHEPPELSDGAGAAGALTRQAQKTCVDGGAGPPRDPPVVVDQPARLVLAVAAQAAPLPLGRADAVGSESDGRPRTSIDALRIRLASRQAVGEP